MNANKRNIIGTCAGFLLALTAGAPVIADDAELLLVAPLSTDQNKPNIMFIIDTSTSMKSDENSPTPYVDTQSYDGVCDSERNYWLEIEGVDPDCTVTTQYIDKDNFFCDAAINQLNGLGSISTTFVQYRDGGPDGTSSGPKKWQTLAAGYDSEPVECQTDAGVHGDGRATHLWAKAGSNLGDWYTDNPAEEISWASAGGGQTYTVYDGNYLNWSADPQTIQVSRIDIVKGVLRTLFESISGVRVGIERFNDDEGGTIILGLIDLDTNRAAALAAVASLEPVDHTTIAESLYESALYWRGLPAEFADIDDGSPANVTDPAILASTSPKVYQQPALNVCAKNYNVLLSDGRAGGRDDKTQGLTPTLPDFQTQLGRSACDNLFGSTSGMCMDDISEYLSKVDIDPILPGDQLVTTHTIGFATDTANLRSTAERSGGNYYLADDAPTLARAMQAIVTVVAERDLSFTAPAVAVNAFNRTQNLNDLYLTVFQPKGRIHWPGNLKKYEIVNRTITDANGLGAINPTTGFFYDSAKSFWTAGSADGNDVTLGGAANELPAPASRKLYTNYGFSNDLTAGSNAITPSNAGSFSATDFGLVSATNPTLDELIRWMRGEDINDEDGDPSTTVRNAMGDPLHSQPAAVVYGGTAASPDVVVYSATNDGYLHALDAATGVELWSFIPKELLDNMNKLYFDPRAKFKNYGIDGDVVPVIADRDNNGIIDGSDFVYVLFGLRRGGGTYYALDVTNKNAPKLLWSVQLAGGGQSWSAPVVARVDINTFGQNADKAVVVIGGGYDTVHDTQPHPTAPDVEGAGVYMLDLVSGAELWRAGRDVGADLRLATMTRAIPNKVRVVDVSGDGLADRIYASDLGGQLLRFDISNGQTPANLVAGGVIARLGAEGLATPTDADTRRFYNTPDASIFTDRNQNRRFISLSIGSGYRAHPLDNSASDRFYSVRDPDVFNKLPQAAYDSYNVVTDADLVEVSGQVRTIVDPAKRGWKFTMPANQKVIAGSLTFDDSVFFVGFSPQLNASDGCAPSLGKNFLYQVSVENGDPVVNNLDTLDPLNSDAERVKELAQGGIAPTPTVLFPSPDDPNCSGADCATPPIGCVGVECFDPGFANNPVRTLWTQDGIE